MIQSLDLCWILSIAGVLAGCWGHGAGSTSKLMLELWITVKLRTPDQAAFDPKLLYQSSCEHRKTASRPLAYRSQQDIPARSSEPQGIQSAPPCLIEREHRKARMHTTLPSSHSSDLADI